MTPFFVYNVGYQTQQNTKGKSLLWITLYSIYLTSFKNNISKSAGLFSLSADIFLWNNGLMMKSTALSTRNSSLISFLSSSPSSNRTGYSGTSTTDSVTEKPWNQSKLTKVRPAPFLKISCALFAGLHMSTSTIIPVDAVNSNVRSAARPLLMVRK